MNRGLKKLVSTFAALVALLPSTALAGTCSSVSVSPLNFGSGIVPGGSGKTINTVITISVNCTSTTSFSLLLGEGSHPTGSGMSAVRHLAGSGGSLTYGLFQDSAHATPWGDGTNVGTGETGYGDGAAQPFLVYASLNVPTSTPLGTYSDTVVVTVSY